MWKCCYSNKRKVKLKTLRRRKNIWYVTHIGTVDSGLSPESPQHSLESSVPMRHKNNQIFSPLKGRREEPFIKGSTNFSPDLTSLREGQNVTEPAKPGRFSLSCCFLPLIRPPFTFSPFRKSRQNFPSLFFLLKRERLGRFVTICDFFSYDLDC